MKLTFTVPGCPKPWKRASQARNGRKYTDPEMLAHQLKIRAHASLVTRGRQLSGQVRLTVECYLPDRRARDWDNLGKNVSDALNGYAYADDSQIWDGHVIKRLDPENPRTVVTLETLENP